MSPNRRKLDELASGFQAGDFGRVEFFELALEAGMGLREIESHLESAEAEDAQD